MVCLFVVLFLLFVLSLYFTDTENASSKGICWGKRQNIQNTCCSTLTPVLDVAEYSCSM